MNFIEEYQLKDNHICSGFLNIFSLARQAGLCVPGASGPNASIQPETKKSTDFWLGNANKIGAPISIWEQYHEELWKFVNDYITKYKFMDFGGTFMLRYLPTIQWYKPGEGYYKWHIDGAQLSCCDRAMVYMTYLNDMSEGGGTMFYHQDYTVTPKKGKTVIFPAAYTHLHKGEISLTQEKYILTGWIWWE